MPRKPAGKNDPKRKPDPDERKGSPEPRHIDPSPRDTREAPVPNPNGQPVEKEEDP